MDIRKAILSDLSIIKRISEVTISEIYPHYYPKGAVDFFLEHHSKGNILDDIKKGIVYLCFDASKNAVGTVTIKNNEICRLFVLPSYQNKGFGTEMLEFNIIATGDNDFLCYDVMEKQAQIGCLKDY